MIMTQKLNFELCILAGLFGGILSCALSPRLLRAQEQTPPPKSISAQQFLLTDEHGSTAGLFGFKDGKPTITLFDSSGRVLWSTDVIPTQLRQ
jgi:hypothetical protein